MAVSFTAQYLHKGALLLSSKEEFFRSNIGNGLGRGLYSLGVIIAAPCGTLYHAVQGARFRIQSSNASNSQAAEPLKLRSTQHLEAAYYDLKGFGQTFLSVVIGVAIVASVSLALAGSWAALFVIAAPLAIGLYNGWIDDILPYQFGKFPPHFLEFISDKFLVEDAPSDRMKYAVNFVLERYVKSGICKEKQLTDEELAEFHNTMISPRQTRLPEPYESMFKIFSLILKFDLVTPRYQARIQAFSDKEKEMITTMRLTLQKFQHQKEEDQQKSVAKELSDKFKTIVQDVVTRFPIPNTNQQYLIPGLSSI